jgi:hypothetical protein
MSEPTDGTAEPGQSAPPPPPAEPVQPASSPPLAKDASTTPANGDGGGSGKGGNGGGDGGGAPKRKREYAPLVITVIAVVFSVALAFVGILVSIFWPYFGASPKLDKTLLQLLADTETARAVSTVAIVVILIVYLAYSAAASATRTTGDGGGPGKGGFGKFFTGTGDGGAPLLVSAVAFLVVALAFVAILWSVFFPYAFVWPKHVDKTLLQQLADTATARGLITFLVAVSTVAIALILIVAMWSAKDDVVKERFGFSKEVLTSLIGILGTIIGFYFGATQDQTHGHGTPTTLTLADVSIVPPKPGPGDTVTLHATLSGGQSPYHYAIRFTPDTIKEIHGDSPDGTIDKEIMHAYDPAKPLDITLQGKDDKGEIISSEPIHLAAT